MNLKSCVSTFVVLTVTSTIVIGLIWSFRGPPPRFRSRLLVQISNNSALFPSTFLTTQLRSPKMTKQFPIPSVILGFGRGVGIGNQLFKYAFAYRLARQLNATLFISAQRSESRQFSPQDRVFALDHFNLDESRFKYMEPDYSWPSSPAEDAIPIKEVDYFEQRIPSNKILIVEDYWESEIFFKPYGHELVDQYQMKLDMDHSEIYKEIQATESVAVHFRIGDFNGSIRILPFDYQIRAMELLVRSRHGHGHNSKQLTFFVFSDDIDYVQGQMQKYNISTDQQWLQRIVYVSKSKYGNLTSIEEFYLMRSCKHIITANSTFSWWAAYLNSNPNKTVIVPYPRQRPEFFEGIETSEADHYKRLVDQIFLYPIEAGWTLLDPKFV